MKIGEFELLRQTDPAGAGQAGKASSAKSAGGFGQVLKDSFEEVNRMQVTAEGAMDDLATGKSQDIHNTMIAIEKADVAFQLLMQVRNKIIAAYEEIHRMQV